VSAHYKSRQNVKDGRKKTGRVILLIFLVFISVGSCGCIKLMQQSEGSKLTQTMTTPQPDPVRTIAPVASIAPEQKISPATPSIPATTPDLVTDAAPILPLDPYLTQHATQINETPLTNHYMRNAEFTRTYILRGNSTGLVVNATVLKGPLWISFDVKPLFDCLDDPESCRGSGTKTINPPYFTLTVRDNQTRVIVAEDGYGREYSSQKDNRTINLYDEGRYHLTLTGNSVDVTLSVATGAAPLVTDLPSADPAPTKTLSPEYLRYLKQTGRAP